MLPDRIMIPRIPLRRNPSPVAQAANTTKIPRTDTLILAKIFRISARAHKMRLGCFLHFVFKKAVLFLPSCKKINRKISAHIKCALQKMFLRVCKGSQTRGCKNTSISRGSS